MRLRVGHQHSWFLSILTRFVDYYSPFWGPEAIYIVVEPQGALTCRSSTIAVWADFGSFLGLLLSFGCPGVISTIYEPRGAFRFGHQHSQFWPILVRFVHYYSPLWGSRAISMVVELQGALTCVSSTFTVFADSGPFLGLLLCFGVPV